jgi:N utilization substance protein A
MSINTKELKEQIDLICIEMGLEPDEIKKAIEVGIASGYRKEFGNRECMYDASFNMETGNYKIWRVIKVVDEVINPDHEISLIEAKLSNPAAQLGDIIQEEVAQQDSIEFGRISSQIAKQSLINAIRSIRHTKLVQEFKDKIGEIVTGEVDYFSKRGYIVKIGQTAALLPKEETMYGEKFRSGSIIKALVMNINEDDRGNAKLILSRRNANFIIGLIKNEVPEVDNGMVVIDKIARDAGNRTKILVSAPDYDDIDPVGTILGKRNVRIVSVMRQIASNMPEKIDVIENNLNNDLELVVADALEPATLEAIEVDYANKRIVVKCTPDEAKLAVGKAGVNVRLASEILGYTIDVQTVEGVSSSKQPQILSEDSESEDGEEYQQG